MLQSSPSPSRRTKRLTLRDELRNRRSGCIHSVESPDVTPPIRCGRVGQADRQHNDNRADRQPTIQPSRHDVVEPHPPAPPPVANPLVEDEANKRPCHVVQRRGGRDQGVAIEDDWQVEEAERRLGPFLENEPEYNGADRANEPPPLQGGVHVARGEDALRADDTPNDGGGVEDLAGGAGEISDGVFGADATDTTDGP